MASGGMIRSGGPRVVVALILAVLAFPGLAQEKLRIRTGSGDPDEKSAVLQLRRLLEKYPLQRWIFTQDVLIEKGAIPHSHPVLTLDAGNLDDDEAQLASFVHEEFHWYLESRREQVDEAIGEFRRIFPDAPVGGGRGARDRESTYLHLVVCDMELQAMTELVGERKAREILGSWRHYTWIYEQVLGNRQVRSVNERYGLLLPRSGADAEAKDASR